MARLTTIDFEGIAPTNGFVRYYNPGGFSQSGVTFTTNNTSLVVVDTGFSSSYYDWGSGALLQAGESPGDIKAALPSGVTAVGSDLSSVVNEASDFVINLSTGDSFTVSSFNRPNRKFVGFTSDVDITWISFNATSGYTQLDNFTFGTLKPITPPESASVPEPASVLGLLTLGGLGIGSVLKRKIK